MIYPVSEHCHKCATQYKITYQGDFCVKVTSCVIFLWYTPALLKPCRKQLLGAL